MIISTAGDDFPFNDIDRLNDEEEALPDIPPFPSIHGQATTTRENPRRNRRRRIQVSRTTSLWLTA